MSISGKGCEKCGYTGCVQERTLFGNSVFMARRPCGACAEPWGPQPLDAPDGSGWWWMCVEGVAPEAVRVEVLTTTAGSYVQVSTTRGTFGPLDLFAPAAKWLRITAPEVTP